MRVRTYRTRNFIIIFSLFLLGAWLGMPRSLRREIEPRALALGTTFTVNDTGDGADTNIGDGICDNGQNKCTLRAAIQEANAHPGNDRINFNIPGSGVRTIAPLKQLPDIKDGVLIDGYTQPGASPNTLSNGDNAVLLIELDGENSGGGSGLTVKASSEIQGLVINRFSIAGILLDATQFEPCAIHGNFIGTNAVGAVALGNFIGVFAQNTGTYTIGGTTPALRNIMSGNLQSGFDDSQAPNGNTIQGNFIGTNAAGTGILSNGLVGLELGDNNLVGGTTASARNVISGNANRGIDLAGSNNKVQGNFIGTDVSGTIALGNKLNSGVLVTGANNTIGGTVPGAGNVISANTGSGIEIEQSGTQVQGNFIGTDVSGTIALGNQGQGVLAFGTDNTIGGTVAGSGNVISGNTDSGIELRNALGSLVQGNFIGTDVSGSKALGNTLSGVLISTTAINNTIGGAVGAGNVIAFNGGDGVSITGNLTVGNAVLTNSIFSNHNLGIDLGDDFGSDGVTPNDAADADSGPNNLQNFPTIVSATTNASTTTVVLSLNSNANTNFTIEFFANSNCDPSGYGEGETFLDSINTATGANGHIVFSGVTLPAVPAGYFITATATNGANNTSEFSQCMIVNAAPTPTPTPTPTPAPTSTLQFGQPNYSVFEDCTALTITVAREGDTTTAATVDYATQSGTASERSDFNTAIGTLSFAPGETAKSFDVLISEDSFTEGTESLSIALSNPTGATLGAQAAATILILDDPPEPATNAIDLPDSFVGQHYHDFLNRQSDTAGLTFWTSMINSCGNDPACLQAQRINTSGAFFLSIEFQETGGFAIRVQRAAFGRKSSEAGTRMTYRQFIHDARFVGDGVVVGQPGYQARLEANKQAYINQVAASADFAARYAGNLTADQFVDALFASAGVIPPVADRQNAINAFGSGGAGGRAAALRSISDANSLRQSEFSPSFVLMQYFGYLRRNPTDAPDNNDNGYQFWLTKLSNLNGDFQKAEMVKAFISSIEYRSRFGQP